MRALGRLVRGLSTLFWCLPLTLVAHVETARTDWLRFFGRVCLSAGAVSARCCGIRAAAIAGFSKAGAHLAAGAGSGGDSRHRQRGTVAVFVLVAPVPAIPFYVVCVVVLAFSVLLFLMQINRVLRG